MITLPRIRIPLLVFLWLFIGVGVADDDSVANQMTLVLNEKIQMTAGLQTTALEASHFGAEFSVTGKAIALQPLLALRNQYLTQLMQSQQSLAKLKQAEKNSQRQQDLFLHGVTSKRNLQEHQLQWQTDKAIVDAHAFQRTALIDEARLVWGDKLAAWSLTTDATKLTGFLSGHDVLLQITLPADKYLVSGNNVIYVDASGDRDKASKATLISETPQTDSTLPGQSYFLKGQGRAIKPGMRVVAWITEKNQTTYGVMIPKSAVIWLLDQLFVYVKTGDKFNRRLVSNYTVTPKGYFASTGFEAGEQVVTVGAQMLLSEEQRRQIPNEDD